jgi:hypothetical protein
MVFSARPVRSLHCSELFARKRFDGSECDWRESGTASEIIRKLGAVYDRKHIPLLEKDGWMRGQKEHREATLVRAATLLFKEGMLPDSNLFTSS